MPELSCLLSQSHATEGREGRKVVSISLLPEKLLQLSYGRGRESEVGTKQRKEWICAIARPRTSATVNQRYGQCPMAGRAG